MECETRRKAFDAVKTAELALLDAADVQGAIAFAVKSLSSLHNNIMMEKSRGTADGKRFKKTQRNNSSGIKGVTFNKYAGKWQAKIGAGAGKARHLGNFQTLEDAVLARAAAEAEMWGQRN